jgi:hypothetical protein
MKKTLPVNNFKSLYYEKKENIKLERYRIRV